MSKELTVLNSSAIQAGGLGMNRDNRLFELKPANLAIVQPNSQVEGAIKGNLRIVETGDQFSEMWCTLLVDPTEQRQYHIGNPGELNRLPENLACFSTDMKVPNSKARIPQAINCASCPKQDWAPWREYKEKNNGQTNKALIPACDSYYRVLLIDSKYKMPLQMFIRSKAKQNFEAGMQNLTRILWMKEAEGIKPNIFDVKFKLTTKLITTGKFVSYVPVFSDFRFVTPEEREQFGAIFLQYIASKEKREQQRAQAAAEAEVETSQENIESGVTEGEYVGSDQEITI